MRYQFWLLLVVGGIAPRRAGGQQAPRLASCLFDSAAHRDTLVQNLAIVARRGADSGADQALSRAIAAIVRERFRPPASIAAMFYPNATGPRFGPFSPGGWAFGAFEVTIRRDGMLGGVQSLASTGDAATDNALLQAVREAAGSDRAADLTRIARGSDVRVRFTLTSGNDSGASTILRMHVPVIRADTPPTTIAMEIPKYPPTALRDRIQTRVELQFMVDEAGQIVRSSLRVVWALSPEFAESAVNAVLAETFRPAMVAGCPVKMNVAQAVNYTIGKR